ncbi:MAG: hypothetical protein FJ306_05270 [Planctomycetes bacterium]|nr:hypothetical protein [Planctomycetota bacterium]
MCCRRRRSPAPSSCRACPWCRRPCRILRSARCSAAAARRRRRWAVARPWDPRRRRRRRRPACRSPARN